MAKAFPGPYVVVSKRVGEADWLEGGYTDLVEFCTSCFAGFGVAGGDVDSGSIGDEAFGYHATYSLATSCDKNDFVLGIVRIYERLS